MKWPNAVTVDRAPILRHVTASSGVRLPHGKKTNKSNKKYNKQTELVPDITATLIYLTVQSWRWLIFKSPPRKNRRRGRGRKRRQVFPRSCGPIAASGSEITAMGPPRRWPKVSGVCCTRSLSYSYVCDGSEWARKWSLPVSRVLTGRWFMGRGSTRQRSARDAAMAKRINARVSRHSFNRTQLTVAADKY